MTYEKKEHCEYPYTDNRLNYCWGYAERKDKGFSDADTERELCQECEFYQMDDIGFSPGPSACGKTNE